LVNDWLWLCTCTALADDSAKKIESSGSAWTEKLVNVGFACMAFGDVSANKHSPDSGGRLLAQRVVLLSTMLGSA
jgi:hypothetical protein